MLAREKRNFQIGPRGIIIAMSVLVLVATIGSMIRPLRQHMALLKVAENGGYREQWNFEDKNWLEANFGYNPFEEVLSITVRADKAVPSLLHNSDAFPELQQLSFQSKTTDASVKYAAEFNKLPKLTSGAFYNTKMTDSGMQFLEDWTRVRYLFFNGGSFTDKGLMHLTNLPELENLSIFGDEIGTLPITDQGLTHFGKIANLKTLYLIGIPITDAGLANLQDLTNLELLAIRRTNVTENGLHRLCKALPNCLVSSNFGSFPMPGQIREISVWKDFPEEQKLLTISDPAQMAAIMVCLERFVGQHKGGWSREWDGNTRDSISLEIEGPNRLICRPSFGDGFFQSGRASYCPLSSSDANELRQILGIDRTE